ncbi:MAG: alpha-L-fucosidase [Bacteroidota bacterium]
MNAQNIEQDSIAFEKKMQWFKDAKLGIFIHWGIYAVNGISESWSFFNGYISYEDYLKQTDGFTAKNYDPDHWAKLIKQSGAKYSVIGTKHHDGFALWNSKFGNFNAAKQSAAKKDVLSPFVKSLRKYNVKLGLYYSLPDWSYKDYTDHTKKVKRYKIADEPKRWEKFLKYYQGQLKELRDAYNPVLWWFDGDWEHNAEEWEVAKVRSLLSEKNKNVIYNSRLRGKGDYETPENGPPVMRPHAKYWELCLTMNDSWGYQHNDKNYKTPQQIVDIFVDCISKGGNLLLDIGPKADGTIPAEQENILKELGKWTSKHSEAIYGTRAGIPYDHFYGPTALSKDSSILYVYVRDIPKDGKIALKGISNKINRIYVVGNGTILKHKVFSKVYWNKYPGVTYIDIPENVLDKYYTVLAVVLEGKVELYREHTGAIESN